MSGDLRAAVEGVLADMERDSKQRPRSAADGIGAGMQQQAREAARRLRAALAAHPEPAAEATVTEADLQRRLYDGEKGAGWDPDDTNTFAEEIAHLHEEVSEAFRAYRLTKTFALTEDETGKPQGVPAELADVAIGMFYIAERWGFDLLAAIDVKHRFNTGRSYAAEGRRLHEPARRVAAPPSEADIAAVRVEWSSRDSLGRVGPTYPPGQGSPYSAQSLLKVGGKPVYRLRTVYRDDVTEWQEFTGDEDPALFFTRKQDLAAAIAAAGEAENHG